MEDWKIRKLQPLKDFSKQTDEEVMEAYKSLGVIKKRFLEENEKMQKGDKSLYPQFRDEKGNLFHTPLIDERTKLLEAAKAENIAAESELLGRGYKKYGSSRFKHPVTKRLLKSLGPFIATGMALSAPSADAAVADVLGVESLGVSDEQRELDRLYKQRIRQRMGDQK